MNKEPDPRLGALQALIAKHSKPNLELLAQRIMAVEPGGTKWNGDRLTGAELQRILALKPDAEPPGSANTLLIGLTAIDNARLQPNAFDAELDGHPGLAALVDGEGRMVYVHDFDNMGDIRRIGREDQRINHRAGLRIFFRPMPKPSELAELPAYFKKRGDEGRAEEHWGNAIVKSYP